MTETTTAERSRYSIRKAIDKLKIEIPISAYLEHHGVEVNRKRARCLVHHGDNPTSFSIDPERALWHCFVCGQGGDLIDLCEQVERHADTWTALVSLSLAFGVELPRRPERWHGHQTDKNAVREQIILADAKRYQRLLFRMFGWWLREIDDPEEYEREAQAYFDDLWPAALVAAKQREARRG